MCLSLDNGIVASSTLYILHLLEDKHETSVEAGQELGSSAWEHDLNFNPPREVELIPERAKLRKLPLNIVRCLVTVITNVAKWAY